MIPDLVRHLVAGAVLLLLVPLARAAERDVRFEMSDGYVLDGKLSVPAGALTVQPKQVVVLVHGSGVQSMDSDLTPVTRDGKKNLFFVDIAQVLNAEGFAVARYNKRSYQAGLSARADRSFVASDVYRKFAERPLHFFIQDAIDVVGRVEKEFPGADVYVLGHSQGTQIALQVAHRLPQVKGVVLIGFALQNMETLMFEQTVYRPLGLFRKIDANHDGRLDAKELAADSVLAAQLRPQMAVLDRDGDGSISTQELQAGNLSNSLLGSTGLHVFKPDEASYPQLQEILSKASFRVLFLPGDLDNQTPAYNAMAVEMAAKYVWKKDNFRFVYFPELGHALDRRLDYDDLAYDVMAEEAKEAMRREAREFLLSK